MLLTSYTELHDGKRSHHQLLLSASVLSGRNHGAANEHISATVTTVPECLPIIAWPAAVAVAAVAMRAAVSSASPHVPPPHVCGHECLAYFLIWQCSESDVTVVLEVPLFPRVPCEAYSEEFLPRRWPAESGCRGCCLAR